MNSEILRENIESLEKIIKNLRDYMAELETSIAGMTGRLGDVEEDACSLESLRDHYVKILEKKENIKEDTK